MKIIIILDQILSKIDMSQHELSRLTDIRQATINEMCRNQTIQLPLRNLAKICDILDCEITDVLKLVKEPTE